MTEQVWQIRRCGRPTKTTGEPCRQSGVHNGVCHRHMTDDERAAVNAREQRLRVEVALYRREFPACWSWPAPATCTFRSQDDTENFLQWWHDGLCAICGRALRSDLVSDHDHRTGLVRGYLCRACNAREGHAPDSNPLYRNYRARNPASILGIKEIYYSPWGGYAEPVPDPSPEEDEAEHWRLRAAVDRMSLPSPESLPDEATSPND